MHGRLGSALVLVVLVAGCASIPTQPRGTDLSPLPTVIPTPAPGEVLSDITTAAPTTLPPQAAPCFCDVYGVPLDTGVTFTIATVAPPPTTPVPPPAAPPVEPPPVAHPKPQQPQPPTTVCQFKNPKKCRP
jgi:hypothetical protein